MKVKEERKFKNNIITEEEEICEEFNTYFIKSIEEIKESIPKNYANNSELNNLQQIESTEVIF